MKNTYGPMAATFVILFFKVTAGTPTKPKLNHLVCDESLEDQNLQHEWDCSKYYRCVYGRKVPKECPDKMLFNPSIGNCDLYYNVDCTDSLRFDADNHNIQNLEQAIEHLTGRSYTLNTKASDATTHKAFTNFETDNIFAIKKIRETSTTKFVYFPYRNHNAYYKIENGRKILLHCNEGMVFNFELEICV